MSMLANAEGDFEVDLGGRRLPAGATVVESVVGVRDTPGGIL